MSSAGNEQNEVFWAPEHGHPPPGHQQQQHQQFIASDPGQIPGVPTSNRYFHPSVSGPDPASTGHGVNYGHPAPGDNFTVLSDGFGNYIKVYHQPSEDVNLNNPAAGKYEYELFASNNSFMRPAPGFGFLFQPQQHQQQQQPVAAAAPPPMPSASHHVQQQEVPPPTEPGSNTSMLINQLVGNWAPTISGTYSPFGGGGPSLLAEGLPRSSEVFVQPQQLPPQQHVAPQQLPQQHQASPVHQPQQPNPLTANPIGATSVAANPSVNLPQSAGQQSQSSSSSSSSVNVSATASYHNQLNDDNSAKLNQNVRKQRIVAEVKPMRMSYSDVLSKNVSSSAAATSGVPASSSSSTAVSSGTGQNVSSKTNASGNSSSSMQSGGSGHGSSGGAGSAKSNKVDKTQSKKNSSQSGDDKNGRKLDRNAVGAGQKKSTHSGSFGTAVSGNQQYGDNFAGSKPYSVHNGTEKLAKKAANLKVGGSKLTKGRETLGSHSSGRKNRSRNFGDAYTVQDVQGPSRGPEELDEDDDEDDDDDEDEDLDVDEDEDDEDEDDYEEYEDDSTQPHQLYNVKKNSNPNDTHIEKISGGGGSSSYKRGRGSGTTRGKPDKSYQQAAATSAATGTGKRTQRPRKNEKYVIFQKVLNTCAEMAVFVVTWLWSLVSDVVYLSLRLCWDYLIAGYQYCEQHFASLRQELQQNRPGSWLKGIWASFDNRFAKDSKWAFWRGKKKAAPAEEQSTTGGKSNYYKDGRLPSTADEAMSSLLNCKGKDAYSILGVSPECSQEQIRKHYKKIAVLVHPDKNKQPGAEEAFKVLQRSFELIGEPENRKSYDQSLAEALNAEKAWSEINDLLTQLHTKISEAANTIRCSSCCLRHPRKPTGRPHYAARECNSCKIRHSAREGDIWAETSFFGLRWKYLAMMEGNVYDITEWANCQKGALSHLQPNSHIVQYRIVLGGNSQQQQQQQQQGGGGGGSGQQQNDKDGGRSRKEAPPSEPNLDDFLNNIYGGQNQQQQQSQSGSRRRHRRN